MTPHVLAKEIELCDLETAATLRAFEWAVRPAASWLRHPGVDYQAAPGLCVASGAP